MVETKDFAGDVALVLEGGFVAVKYGDRETALNCFHAAKLLAPNRVEPKVGLATLALNELNLDKAIALCDEVLQQDPESYQAMVIAAMSLILLHKEEERARKLLNSAKENSPDEATRQLAELWLGYLEMSHHPSKPLKPEAKKRLAKEISKSEQEAE